MRLRKEIVERVRLHSHAPQGFDGQRKSAKEIILNAGISHIEFSRISKGDAIACIGIDNGIDSQFLSCDAARIKIALLLETPELNGKAIDSVRELHSRLDLVLTYSPGLLREFPDQARMLWLGGSYLRGFEFLRGDPKMPNISISVSRKNSLEGHKLRHEVVRNFRQQDLKVFGRGYRPYRSPKKPYEKFMYSIVVENSRQDHYFTEKLVQCLLFRCVPVYWGTAKLPKEFDERGILRFSSLKELEEIWPTLTAEKYQGLRRQISSNQRAALKYCSTDFTVQRMIAEFLEISELREITIENYFKDFERVLRGRAPFKPSPRARFLQPATYW